MLILKIFLGFECSHHSHWAAPEPMCLPVPTMTKVGCWYATKCIILIHTDVLHNVPQRLHKHSFTECRFLGMKLEQFPCPSHFKKYYCEKDLNRKGIIHQLIINCLSERTTLVVYKNDKQKNMASTPKLSIEERFPDDNVIIANIAWTHAKEIITMTHQGYK